VSIGAAVAAGCLCAVAAEQATLRQGAWPSRSMPGPWNVQRRVLIIPSAPGNAPLPALAPAGKPELKVQPARLSPRVHPPFTLFPVPGGVYRTEPYSCIVVVPGPHPDDRCIVNPGSGHYSMPIIKPDLRFIPKDSAGR
jgi:hypothetical protein